MEEYCAVFWSVLSVYVYLLFVRVSLRVCDVIVEGCLCCKSCDPRVIKALSPHCFKEVFSMVSKREILDSEWFKVTNIIYFS